MFSVKIVHNPSVKLRGTIKSALEHHKKYTHARVKYHIAPKPHEDRCRNCTSYRERDECVKVQSPISPDGWCMAGHGNKDGHPFDKKWEAKEKKEYGP